MMRAPLRMTTPSSWFVTTLSRIGVPLIVLGLLGAVAMLALQNRLLHWELVRVRQEQAALAARVQLLETVEAHRALASVADHP